MMMMSMMMMIMSAALCVVRVYMHIYATNDLCEDT